MRPRPKPELDRHRGDRLDGDVGRQLRRAGTSVVLNLAECADGAMLGGLLR